MEYLDIVCIFLYNVNSVARLRKPIKSLNLYENSVDTVNLDKKVFCELFSVIFKTVSIVKVGIFALKVRSVSFLLP